MKYCVNKATVKVVNKVGSANHGKKYIVLTMSVPDDISDSREVPIFDEPVINQYLAYISTQNGGTLNAATDAPLPDGSQEGQPDLVSFPLCFDQEFMFPEPMVRVRDDGTPEMNKFGQMYIRSSIIVLCRKRRDNETGELSWRKGWDPTSRGTSVMNAFYVPLRTFNSANATVPQMGVPGQPAAAPAAAVELPV